MGKKKDSRFFFDCICGLGGYQKKQDCKAGGCWEMQKMWIVSDEDLWMKWILLKKTRSSKHMLRLSSGNEGQRVSGLSDVVRTRRRTTLASKNSGLQATRTLKRKINGRNGIKGSG